VIRLPMAPNAKEPTQPTMPPATIRALASLWADILVADLERNPPSLVGGNCAVAL
jgi:hypothetical protein